MKPKHYERLSNQNLGAVNMHYNPILLFPTIIVFIMARAIAAIWLPDIACYIIAVILAIAFLMVSWKYCYKGGLNGK